jgi:hypothetical protein
MKGSFGVKGISWVNQEGNDCTVEQKRYDCHVDQLNVQLDSGNYSTGGRYRSQSIAV